MLDFFRDRIPPPDSEGLRRHLDSRSDLAVLVFIRLDPSEDLRSGPLHEEKA